MDYTKELLELDLEKNFLLDDKAFSNGRINDDVVDSMIMCHCVDRDWFEFIAKKIENMEGEWSKNHIDRIIHKAEMVQPYLDKWGAVGTMEATSYLINY